MNLDVRRVRNKTINHGVAFKDSETMFFIQGDEVPPTNGIKISSQKKVLGLLCQLGRRGRVTDLNTNCSSNLNIMTRFYVHMISIMTKKIV